VPFVSSSSSDAGGEETAENDVTRTRTSVAVARDHDDGSARPTSLLGPPDVPTHIGKYRVTGYLGRGGMGVVLSAHDTELQRDVALKLLQAGAWGASGSMRMEREAQAMAKLSHPNVVTVYEVGRDQSRPFIAMELVTGGTLRDWLRAEKRSWRRTLEMVIAAGRGLVAAHAAGLVHRDFKPENVLVGSDGRPRVTDFGLVASSLHGADTDRDAGRAGSSVIAGTPPYMPPEQWSGDEVDARADQFAFAVTCWEALWGVRPFPSRSARDGVDVGSPSEPERLRSRRGVPRRVEAALRRALQSDRGKRWPKLGELLDRLERIGRDRRPVLAGVVLVSAAAVGALAFRAGGGETESPCRMAGASIADVWNPARLAKLRDAYASRTETSAVKTWQATEEVLGAWVEEHRAIRIEICELGRTGGAGLGSTAAARTVCLDEGAAFLAALLSALEQPDSTTMAYARAAALGLPRSSACRSATPAEPVAIAQPTPPRTTLEEAHGTLARAFALRALGKPREAIALAEPVATRADELSWRPLIASAYLELGLGHQANHDSKRAEAALQRAILFADASRDDDVRFSATIALSENAMQRSSYDEAARAIESARMIALRLPEDDTREIVLANQEARLPYWRGEFADCVKRAHELIAVVDQILGKGRMAVEARLNLSRCLQAMGKTSEYGPPLREALSIMEASTGREHPYASDAILGLGAIAREENRPEEALELLREALAIRERAFGSENPDVAKVHNNIGNVLRDLGRVDEARQSLERALEIWENSWGPDSPAVAVASSNLGRIALARGDVAAAEAYFARALEIRRKMRPAGHPDLTGAMVRMGEVLLVKRDPACLPLLREAVAANKTNEARQEQRDEAVFMLGRALVELRVDPAEGQALMAGACAVYDAANDPFDCRAYLAKQPRR